MGVNSREKRAIISLALTVHRADLRFTKATHDRLSTYCRYRLQQKGQVELYHDAIREDPGDYDWSVLVKGAALGQVNEEIPPQALIEPVEQLVVGQEKALLEYDTSWLGLVIEDLWIFAKLYLIVSTSSAAVVHRI